MQNYLKMLKSNFATAKFLLTAVFLMCSVKAIQFDCTFGTYHNYSPIGARYGCKAVVTNSGAAFLKNVTGIHQTGKSNDDVELLLIDRQRLTFIA